MPVSVLDVKLGVKGLSEVEKATKRIEALEKNVKDLEASARKTGSALPVVGKGAKGAAAGMKAFGASINAALGPIAPLLAAVAGLGKAFQTLSAQDFAEAKVRTLGTNSDDLVVSLNNVSRELQGQASVAELTGAAYDVASAGFTKAADSAEILRAASLGATGGFSDINTVANAATSVLNAYGQSADQAAALVDGFIQTQNDGKIVVAQYAAEVGKVASAAAGLNVPMTEVNAVIAQSTAAGVKAEVAFTGLKTAMARFASGEAEKALKGTGIEINAATLEAEGMVETLRKLQGLDTGQIFKALGTEAAPALLPVIQNLERYEELIQNQENAAGAAARAQAEAANTIQGAWKRVTVAFENLFSDQSELGDVIQGTLMAAAATVELLGAAFKLLVAPIRGVAEAITGLIQPFLGVEQTAAQTIQSINEGWFNLMKVVEQVGNFISLYFQEVFNGLVQMTQMVWEAFGSLWNGIAEGAGNVGTAIVNAFQSAFSFVLDLANSFYNSLPGWLKDALGKVGGAISGAMGSVVSGIAEGVGKMWKQAGDMMGGGEITTTVTAGGLPTAPNLSTGGVGGGGGSGGSGGGKGGGADAAAKKAEQTAQQLQAAQELLRVAENELQLKQQMSEIDKLRLESAVQIEDIQKKYSDLISKSLSIEEETTLEAARAAEIKGVELELEQELAQLKEDAGQSIKDEIAQLQAKLAGKEDELRIEKELARLRAAGYSPEEANNLVRTRDALKGLTEQQDAAKASAQQLASGISGALTDSLRGLIDGSMTAEEALANAFQGIADAFLDMAMQMIQQWIQMQLMGLVSGMFGGAPGLGGGMGGGAFSIGLGAFADGGYVTEPTAALIGEAGEDEYVIPSGDMDAAMARYSQGARGESVLNGPAPAGGSADGGGGVTTVNYTGPTLTFNDQDYVPRSAVPDIISKAAKQGATQTMAGLRNSRGQRAKVGMKG